MGSVLSPPKACAWCTISVSKLHNTHPSGAWVGHLAYFGRSKFPIDRMLLEELVGLAGDFRAFLTRSTPDSKWNARYDVLPTLDFN